MTCLLGGQAFDSHRRRVAFGEKEQSVIEREKETKEMRSVQYGAPPEGRARYKDTRKDSAYAHLAWRSTPRT